MVTIIDALAHKIVVNHTDTQMLLQWKKINLKLLAKFQVTSNKMLLFTYQQWQYEETISRLLKVKESVDRIDVWYESGDLNHTTTNSISDITWLHTGSSITQV